MFKTLFTGFEISRVVVLAAIGLIGLTTLAGCSSKPQATATQPSQSSMSSTGGTSETKAGFEGLDRVIANTKTAVAANDFAKAKTEFDQFETYWQQVEDGVKVKSAATYDAIEQGMDQISGELNANQPDKSKVTAALQTLQTNVNTVAQ